MNIHKEGYRTIAIAVLIFGAINIIFFYFFSAQNPFLSWVVFGASLVALLFIISFYLIFQVAQKKFYCCPSPGYLPGRWQGGSD